jgi:hypothetical protein
MFAKILIMTGISIPACKRIEPHMLSVFYMMNPRAPARGKVTAINILLSAL